MRLDTHLKNSSTCKVSATTTPHTTATPPRQSNVTPSHQEGIGEQQLTTGSGNITPPGSPRACGVTEGFGTTPPLIDPSCTLLSLKLPQTPEEWLSADEALASSTVPAVAACSSVEGKNETLSRGLYQYFSQTYGTQERRRRKARRKNDKRLKKLAQQKNEAKKKMKKERREGLNDKAIREVAREFHRLLRVHSKASKLTAKNRAKMEAMKARSACAKSFWRFAAEVVDDDEQKVNPMFSAEEAETFFRGVYSSTPREFLRPEWLPAAQPPTHPFNEERISREEIQDVLNKSKSRSTPNPQDQIPYTVLKNCPSLMVALMDLYNACWSSSSIPTAWNSGVIRLIPKASAAGNAGTPSNFRPIALTSCIGKVFLYLHHEEQMAGVHATEQLHRYNDPEGIRERHPWLL